jgi:23S rRNA (guanosine2251-2'-O)-methyltransferase
LKNPKNAETYERPDDVVAGRHPVLEAVKSGRTLNKILVAQGAEGGSLTELLARAKELHLVVQRVPKAKLDAMAGKGHQGVVALMSPHAYAELEDVLNRSTGQAPLVVLLDEIHDPHNLGAIIRSAEAAGAKGVVIPKRRSVLLTTVVSKAAAGAVEYIPVARVGNLVQAMERLKQAGYWVVGLDVAGQQMYTEVDYRGATAVVIGAEGTGLGKLVRERCDFLVKLPMLGQVSSLNASVATGVLLYETLRQRQ